MQRLISRHLTARLWDVSGICGRQNSAGEGVYNVNFTNQSFFGKSIGSLELWDAPHFSLEFEFCAKNLRNWASISLNLSWEVQFFVQFFVPMAGFYTVIFKT